MGRRSGLAGQAMQGVQQPVSVQSELDESRFDACDDQPGVPGSGQPAPGTGRAGPGQAEHEGAAGRAGNREYGCAGIHDVTVAGAGGPADPFGYPLVLSRSTGICMRLPPFLVRPTILPVSDLGEQLDLVGRGTRLSASGVVSLVPAPPGTAVAAVLAFTAHHLIAADVDPALLTSWLGSTKGSAEIGRPMQPDFLAALGAHLNAKAGGQDVLLVTTGTGDREAADQYAAKRDPEGMDHPRAVRAVRYREDVRVATMPGGLVTIGRGLAGRWEISVEVDPPRRGAGIGRALATQGRTLVPAGAVLWAQVHPANVASMRAFLAAGYRPVGAEVLFTRLPPPPIP